MTAPAPLKGPIVVLGATSGIGRLVMDVALSRGHTVRAVARSADSLAPRERLSPMAGDARDPAALDRALVGASAVIYCLGIKERPAMIWQEERLFSESTANLLDRMTAAGVMRLVAVTGYGAGRSRDAMPRLARLGHGLVLGKVYADKTRQEALIEASDRDWTIARPVILTNRPARGRVSVETDPGAWRNGFVARADVAAWLVDAVEQGMHRHADPVIRG